MIVNPNDTTHTVIVIPRFDVIPASGAVSSFVSRVDSDNGITEDSDCVTGVVGVDFLSLTITDSFKGTSVSVSNTFDVVDGEIILTFDYTFTNDNSYSIAIRYINTSEVIYRGFILATTQDTQDYSLTKSEYNWK